MINSQLKVTIFILVILMTINDNGGAAAEKDKVNSKLDLNASDEDSSTTTHHGHGNKKSPKIQGVRVTVDTGNSKKSAAESGSKESVEIVESKKGKRVGIHTDITFELTDGDDDNNSTSSDKDDADASIPVYKGRNGGSNHRPRRPYDPKTNWQPHHRDQESRHNPSTYPKRNDEEFYRSANNNDWTGFIPITSVWTTERSSYYGSYQPKSMTGYKSGYDLTGPQWKPCYCVSTDGRNRRDGGRVGYLRVDDKLDSAFNDQQKRKHIIS